MNLRKSIMNKNSRFSRIHEYLQTFGPSTKKQILRDVFGVDVGHLPDQRTRGWASYVFSLGVAHGHFRKVRKGNTVLWSIVLQEKN